MVLASTATTQQANAANAADQHIIVDDCIDLVEWNAAGNLPLA